MSVNQDMIEYFITEFYCTKSVNLSEQVTPNFKFYLAEKIPLNFKQYVKMAEAIRNLVKLNILEIRSKDDVVFEMDYLLDVLLPFGGFGKEISGKITIHLVNDLVDKIYVTRSRHDPLLEEYAGMRSDDT